MDHLTKSQCQHSLDLVVGQEEAFARAFFALLLNRLPEVKVLFAKDINTRDRQLQVLCTMMFIFVGDDDNLTTKLRVLGFRMAMHGLRVDHFEVMAATFIGTLKRQIGSSWQSDFAHAWSIARVEALEELEKGTVLMAA